MQIEYSKQFIKRFIKYNPKIKTKIVKAIETYLENPQDPSIRLHTLKGAKQQYLSLSAGGDLRIHIRIMDSNTILIVEVGSHSQLYE